MSHSTTTEFLSKLSEGETICFKYSGGSWPGVPRTLYFHSWYIGGPIPGAYMTAYDSNGNFKTFHCSKMSDLSSSSQSNSVKEEVSENNFSNWTSWIKKNDIIQFSYSDEAEIRNVTFVTFMNSSTKRKILAYQNGYTKTFFINKMKVHKIFEVDEQYNKKNDTDSDFEDYSQTDTVEDDEMSISSSESISSPQELHNEIKQLETKQEILIKQMKAHIDSQNVMIEKFKQRMFLLEEDCIHLEEDKKKAYCLMSCHRRLYPTTWKNDFEPKEPSGWEVINPPTSQ
jgi:hypothetical protein